MPLSPIVAGEVLLDEPTARYVGRVHRLHAGDRFVAFDPEVGIEADAEVLGAGREVRCRLGAPRASLAVSKTRVTLLQALGKGDKPDQVIRDATALGASRIVLVETNRSVVQLDEERRESRKKRWRTVAVESARQCGRGDLPEIQGPSALESALTLVADVESRLHLSPTATNTLADVLGQRPAPGSVALLIGPEGGFDAPEEAAAVAAGFTPVSLGPFVLRTETAAVAALAVVTALQS